MFKVNTFHNLFWIFYCYFEHVNVCWLSDWFLLTFMSLMIGSASLTCFVPKILAGGMLSVSNANAVGGIVESFSSRSMLDDRFLNKLFVSSIIWKKTNKLVNVLKRKVFNNYEIFRQFSSHYYLKKRNDFHSMYLIEFYYDFKFPILKLNILKSQDLQIMIQSSIPNIYDGAFCENS